MRLSASSRGRAGAGQPRYESQFTLRQIQDYLLHLPPVGDTSGLSLVSGAVQSATVDASGKTFSASSSGQRPAYDTSNGYPEIVTTAAASSDLQSATGGLSGSAPAHGMWWFGDPGATTGFRGLVGYGPSASGNTTLGTASPDTCWGGGSGFGGPVYNSVATGEHFYWKDFDGTTSTIRLDGEELLAGTADLHTLVMGGTNVGVCPAFSAAVCDARMQGAGWFRSMPSLTARRRIERYWRRRRQLTSAAYLAGVGDSQTAGWAATVGHTWKDQITGLNNNPTYLSGAVAGRTTDDILANYMGEVVKRGTGLRPLGVAVVWVATNDLFAGKTGAYCWANLQTIGATLAATQFWIPILLLPLPRTEPGTAPTYETECIALRALAQAGWMTTGYHAIFDPATLFPSSDDTNDFQGDKVHLNVSAEGRLATALAPILNRWF